MYDKELISDKLSQVSGAFADNGEENDQEQVIYEE